MAGRVRTKQVIPNNIVALAESRANKPPESVSFRNFYAIPGGDEVDLTLEMDMRVGVERVWRASNIGGRLGRLILTGRIHRGVCAGPGCLRNR